MFYSSLGMAWYSYSIDKASQEKEELLLTNANSVNIQSYSFKDVVVVVVSLHADILRSFKTEVMESIDFKGSPKRLFLK